MQITVGFGKHAGAPPWLVIGRDLLGIFLLILGHCGRSPSRLTESRFCSSLTKTRHSAPDPISVLPGPPVGA